MAVAPTLEIDPRSERSTRSSNGLIMVEEQNGRIMKRSSVSLSASSSSVLNVSATTKLITTPSSCDACPHCSDTCGDDNCANCSKKQLTYQEECCWKGGKQVRCYTMCEIQRHNHVGSAWIVAGDDVYDCTSYINSHPGGINSILKKTGGVCDCSIDLQFHSKRGRKVWQQYHIGKVRKCCAGNKNKHGEDEDRQWWMFWA